MSTQGDQRFRDASPYDALCKFPHIYFADALRSDGGSSGYINNSLEGSEFNAESSGAGTIALSSGLFTPNFSYFDSGDSAFFSISDANILNRQCTITTAGDHSYTAGDVVAINGIDIDATHPFINGTHVIYSVPSSSTFIFEIRTDDTPTPYGSLATAGRVSKGYVFSIFDNRPITDAKGKSFTSTMFTMKEIYRVNPLFKRILPSDLYTRFRFQSGDDANAQGGINLNLFNVFDTDGTTNIKPVLWSYFFGYNDTIIPSNEFQIAFNSYAIVLRPSGSGIALEFAIVKFNWGTDASNWMNDIVGQSWFNKYTVSGTDLGYLISSNPSIGNNKVTELAKSDPFTYDSSFAAKFNLKITIRKHLSSDAMSDGTYLVNLMINNNYDVFGENQHYDSILHSYIDRPAALYNIADGSHPHDSMLMPMMYFKFVNINEQNVGIPTPFGEPPTPGSSSIFQDSLFFRQINASAVNDKNLSYLY